MIEEHAHKEMRSVGSGTRERAVINDCGWRGSPSSRKALLIVDEHSGGRLLTLDDLRNAALDGLPMTARAGNSSSLINIAEVIEGYDTDMELPVLFVDEEDGEETLSMFLYDMPGAV